MNEIKYLQIETEREKEGTLDARDKIEADAEKALKMIGQQVKNTNKALPIKWDN